MTICLNLGHFWASKPYHWAVVEAADLHGMILMVTSNKPWWVTTFTIPLLPHMMAQIWGVTWNPEFLLETKPYHCTLVEAPDPSGMVPKSNMYINMDMDNLHMVWMIRWIHHHAATTAAVGTYYGSCLTSWVAAGHLTKPLWTGWGCRFTWNGDKIILTYARCFATFICCEWTDESIAMPLPPHLMTQIWECSWNTSTLQSLAESDGLFSVKNLANVSSVPSGENHPRQALTGPSC